MACLRRAQYRRYGNSREATRRQRRAIDRQFRQQSSLHRAFQQNSGRDRGSRGFGGDGRSARQDFPTARRLRDDPHPCFGHRRNRRFAAKSAYNPHAVRPFICVPAARAERVRSGLSRCAIRTSHQQSRCSSYCRCRQAISRGRSSGRIIRETLCRNVPELSDIESREHR